MVRLRTDLAAARAVVERRCSFARRRRVRALRGGARPFRRDRRRACSSPKGAADEREARARGHAPHAPGRRPLALAARVRPCAGANIRSVSRIDPAAPALPRRSWTRRRKRLAAGAGGAVVVLGSRRWRSDLSSGAGSRGRPRGAARGPGRVGSTGLDRRRARGREGRARGDAGRPRHASTVRVDLRASLSVDAVTVSDAKLELEGDALAEIAAWRERHTSGTEKPGPQTPVRVERAALSWKARSATPRRASTRPASP